MDKRSELLKDLRTELTTTTPGRNRTRWVGGIAAGLVAGTALLTLGAGPAAAAEPQSRSDVAANNCFQPDHVPYTHVKQCPSIVWVSHSYKYTYSPNGGIVYCYVFDTHVNNPCGSGTYESESCA